MTQTADILLVHDLIRFDPSGLTGQDMPDWISAALDLAPLAVIRRQKCEEDRLPVGIRGPERHQRWGGWLSRSAVKETLSPESLVGRVKELPAQRLAQIPALKALQMLAGRFENSALIWGATGSVGFELASGQPTAKTSSDLDLIVRCPQRISHGDARALFDMTQGLDIRCDVLLETPPGAVALAEFLKGETSVVVRTTDGPVLMKDPWLKG